MQQKYISSIGRSLRDVNPVTAITEYTHLFRAVMKKTGKTNSMFVAPDKVRATGSTWHEVNIDLYYG